METVRVGGRKYSDPDIISLIRATGQLIDPRAAVITQAKRLNAEFEALKDGQIDPVRRLEILASLRGLEVKEMSREARLRERRDAILVPLHNGKSGLIVYNPTRPRGRVAFSIAHEIAHTFFPNSMNGARFRAVCLSDSREANELERLCDLGASEILMPDNEFRAELGGEFGLNAVPRLSEAFASSFEATVFRLASTYHGVAVAGLLRYRLRVSEERALVCRARQGVLFGGLDGPAGDMVPAPKYRRQALHTSADCSDDHVIRWNKSFEPDSCVYAAGQGAGIIRGRERLPTDSDEFGTIEAIRAPFQRQGADANFGDVLFLWWQR